MSTQKNLENWERIFSVDTSTTELPDIVKKCSCGSATCKRAKKIKCVCRCHSEFHGIEQRRGMQPLDKALGLDRPEIEFPVEPPSPEELAIW